MRRTFVQGHNLSPNVLIYLEVTRQELWDLLCNALRLSPGIQSMAARCFGCPARCAHATANSEKGIRRTRISRYLRAARHSRTSSGRRALARPRRQAAAHGSASLASCLHAALEESQSLRRSLQQIAKRRLPRPLLCLPCPASGASGSSLVRQRTYYKQV